MSPVYMGKGYKIAGRRHSLHPTVVFYFKWNRFQHSKLPHLSFLHHLQALSRIFSFNMQQINPCRLAAEIKAQR